jgi:hypothetical protein
MTGLFLAAPYPYPDKQEQKSAKTSRDISNSHYLFISVFKPWWFKIF